jgi:predicted O-linked N-acetylglucosamine transferase (SPINDLY family)
MPDPHDLFPAAVRAHQAGRLPEAEGLYRRLLQQQPAHGDALHLLGLVLSQTGRLEEAAGLLQRAVALRGDQPAFHNNLGEVYRQLGRLDQAEACLRRALDLAPDFPEAHYNLANSLKGQGRHAEAIASYRRAVELRPGYAKALYNLANTLSEEGRVKEAVGVYRQALAVQPDWRDALLNLGNAYSELHDLEAAIAAYRRAEALAPDDPDLAASLGRAYLAQGKTAEAAAWYRRELSRRPDDWLRRLRLETLCEPVLPDNAAIDAYRARLAETLERYHGQKLSLPAERLHASGAEPPMALAYHGRDDLPLKTRYAALFAAAVSPQAVLPGTGKPHVGVVVTHGHEGVFAECLGGVVEHVDRGKLQVTVICSRSGANVLRQLLRQPDLDYLVLPERVDEAAERVRQARIDLLHYWEVGTDSTNYFLPFFRPAARQSACWGWPVTTGNPRIDYFLSSRLIEPDEGDGHYSERLVRLETLPTYYRRPPVPATLRSRAHFGLEDAGRYYLCIQNVRKYHPDFDALLAGILEADPEGRLLLVGDEQPAITELLLRRLRPRLGRGQDRVRVVPRMERPDYLSLIARTDVVLDTVHYSGGANTACDVFAVGTPAVTLPGTYHRGRYTAAAYRKLGITELLAASAAEYVRLAVRVATELDFQQDLRRRILAASAVLFEDLQAVREHEEFFLRAIAEGRRG